MKYYRLQSTFNNMFEDIYELEIPSNLIISESSMKHHVIEWIRSLGIFNVEEDYIAGYNDISKQLNDLFELGRVWIRNYYIRAKYYSTNYIQVKFTISRIIGDYEIVET